ncbi:MAG: cytochrome c oxidase assembly protein, partial [Candidatus Eremiobacteraeota bacterium]|nr:cytochrome c oxidase assembly protein [Candidatus Eremiobacteraeota bacterium]
MIVALAAGALLYLAGIVRARARGVRVAGTAIVAFACALALAACSSLGPIDALADGSLAWHMVQHLIVSFAVAPLLLLAAPIRISLAALPVRFAARVAAALLSSPVRIVTNPAVAWLQFVAVLYGVHFSPMYEAALEHLPIHVLEHVLFLTSALVFWTPILAVAPAPHAPPHPVRLLMIFLALPASAFLGFVFYVTRGVLYPHYAGTFALADQANAGAVMWIAGSAPLLAALLWCVADWGARE